MKYIIIIFICFLLSLGIVIYQDDRSVLTRYDESVYVFNDRDDFEEIVVNPDTSDINIYVSFVLWFYSLLFCLIFIIKMKISNRYSLR